MQIAACQCGAWHGAACATGAACFALHARLLKGLHANKGLGSKHYASVCFFAPIGAIQLRSLLSEPTLSLMGSVNVGTAVH